MQPRPRVAVLAVFIAFAVFTALARPGIEGGRHNRCPSPASRPPPPAHAPGSTIGHLPHPRRASVPPLSKITCIEALRLVAARRVPRMFYDYADSGSYTEGTYRANEADFQAIKLRQRVAVNMEGRSTRTTMVGQDVAMPVAIAPTGLTGMQH